MVISIQSAAASSTEPDIVLLIDRQGICHEYLTANALLPTNMTTTSPREYALGQPVERLLPAALTLQLRTALTAMNQDVYAFVYIGKPIIANQDDRTVECLPRHYAVRLTPCSEDRVLCVLRDITSEEQVRKDNDELMRAKSRYQQTRKMVAIQRLAGGVAHFLNNILTVIISHSDLALPVIDETDALHKKIVRIQEAGERAAQFTQQLLVVSGKQQIEPTMLNLNDLLRHLINDLGQSVGEVINLSSDLATELHPIKADPRQLEQAITALMTNAHEAMPQGGQLSFETQNVLLTNDSLPVQPNLVAGHYIRLTIRDTGNGLDAESQNHIFEPFFTTKAADQWASLGLSTVYGIVSRHHGFLDVESEDGIGTAIHIFLPRSSEPLATPLISQQSIETRQDDSQMTILAVDDDRAILDLITMILEEEGYSVVQATSGADALALVTTDAQRFDLLVSDVMMPGMTGYELYEQLALQYPALKVIFISGYTDTENPPEHRNESQVAFLSKPFTWQQLLQRVRQMLDN